MKKKLGLLIIPVVIILGVVIYFVFIKENKKQMADFKLKIRESSWSGWTEDYKPKEVTNEYDIILNKEYVIKNDVFVFTIKEIGNDYIVIKTTNPFSDNEKGINLRTDKTEFTINSSKETKLMTPTMDAGYTYYLILTK